MLGQKTKEPTKAEMQKKVEAWHTINKVLVETNAKFMNTLASTLTEKQVQHDQLREKLTKNEGSEEDNANFIFLGGYIQCLKDILGIKNQSEY